MPTKKKTADPSQEPLIDTGEPSPESPPAEDPTPKAEAAGKPTPRAPKVDGPPKTLAEELLEQYEVEQRTAKEAAVEDDAAKYQYFFRCDKCNGAAIFFTKNPVGQEIRSNEWFSVYHDVDEPDDGSPLPCQTCMKRGVTRIIPVTRLDYRNMTREQRRGRPFRVKGRHQRYLMKVPVDPAQRAKEPRRRATIIDAAGSRVREVLTPEESAAIRQAEILQNQQEAPSA